MDELYRAKTQSLRGPDRPFDDPNVRSRIDLCPTSSPAAEVRTATWTLGERSSYRSRPCSGWHRQLRRSTRDDDGLELDWVAHDIRKFVKMMVKHNGYVLEQLFSRLVVAGGAELDELRELGRGCVTRGLFRHYRGFAHGRVVVTTPKVDYNVRFHRGDLVGLLPRAALR
jgi:hypothetical protein